MLGQIAVQLARAVRHRTRDAGDKSPTCVSSARSSQSWEALRSPPGWLQGVRAHARSAPSSRTWRSLQYRLRTGQGHQSAGRAVPLVPVGGAAVHPHGQKVLRGIGRWQCHARRRCHGWGQGTQQVVGTRQCTVMQQQPCRVEVLDKPDALQEAVLPLHPLQRRVLCERIKCGHQGIPCSPPAAFATWWDIPCPSVQVLASAGGIVKLPGERQQRTELRASVEGRQHRLAGEVLRKGASHKSPQHVTNDKGAGATWV